MRHLIFLVEAQAEVRQRIQLCLEQAGYSVRAFSTSSILREAEILQPRLILAAMMLPNATGLDLSSRIRQNQLLGRTPLMFLLDPAAPGQRYMAMESDADGFLLNSAPPHELLSRIRSVLRRGPASLLWHGDKPPDIAIDLAAMRLSVRGQEVQVTSLEFRLIEYLCQHRGQVFTRDVLLDAVWGDFQFVTPRSVDACILRIRKKIEPNPTAPTLLRTVRGTGYRLDAVAHWQMPAKEACDCKTCKSAVSSRNNLRRQA